MQHLSDLGRIGLGSRLKRLSDYLISEVNAIYKESGIRFEASCFPLLSLLERHGPLSMREAEQKMGTTHSYISQKAKYLLSEGLLQLEADAYDRRTKKMALTQKGAALIEQARPHWKAMDRTFAELFYPDERRIFETLAMLEDRLMTVPFRDRIREFYNVEPDGTLQIENYRPEFKEAFRELNLEWLEKLGKNFPLMAFDHKAFNNPESVFLKEGGDIFFITMNNQAIGTAALYPAGGSYELCKMGVDPRYRGRGIGKKLVAEGITRARAAKAESIYLLTHSKKLAPALRLYREMGFTEAPLTEEDLRKYSSDRVDTRMEMHLL